MNVVDLNGVSKYFGKHPAVDNISFTVPKGALLSLLGPSGCGKTTTLRLIAGFENADVGAIYISGVDMHGKRPYERNVGLLFQDYALFPHMSVRENISYGLRHRGVPKSDIPGRIAEMLNLVKLKGLEERFPQHLSGGQQQRVALARALATKPEVLLLDEPLSALDAKLRQELRVELKEILTVAGATTIVVTHDQDEAMSLGEHIIVMNQGQIMQQGSPRSIYERPRNKFVAEFIGRSNWFSGHFTGPTGGAEREFQTTDGLTIQVTMDGVVTDQIEEIGIRPERMRVEHCRQEVVFDSAVNVLQGVVSNTQFLGSDLHLWVRLQSGTVVHTIQQNQGEEFADEGDPVVVRFKKDDCMVIDSNHADN